MCNCSYVVKDTIETPNLPLDNEISANQRFENFPSFSLDLTPNAYEPDFVNPNSYETINQVFRAGRKQNGGVRDWVFVERDVLSYNTLREILDIYGAWCCNKCKNFLWNRKFSGQSVFSFRKGLSLPQIFVGYSSKWSPAFRKIMKLSFIKLNWPVFEECLRNTLEFHSLKAQ